jgi:hypothetical protein
MAGRLKRWAVFYSAASIATSDQTGTYVTFDEWAQM